MGLEDDVEAEVVAGSNLLGGAGSRNESPSQGWAAGAGMMVKGKVPECSSGRS